MSGNLERSGQPRGAQATVALVWWRGMELTWSWGGGGGKLDSGRTLPKGKPRAYATLSCDISWDGGAVEGESSTLAEHFKRGNPEPMPPVYCYVHDN